jgi:hypothetical protein
MNAPLASDVWRLTALSMMPRAELDARLSGESREALRWISAAAHCGLSDAQVQYGRLLLAGEKTAQDRPAAFAWFDAAASAGNADGHNMLGRCYEMGWGVAADMTRAAQHYRFGAEAGLDWAQYNFGHLLLDGLGVPRDVDAAFAWYRRAAEQGHVRAMNLMGRCCEEGWGTARNAEAARAWYRKSAMGGYFRGAYNYASLLATEGCIAGARFWFACALNSASAQTRANIRRALAAHPQCSIRALAGTSPY